MEIGNLEIIGTLNAENLKAGLADMRRSLTEVASSAKGTFGDIKRMAGPLKEIGKYAGMIGTGLVGAFMGLATMAPQIAPHLERMKADFFRLSTIVGEHFEPVFSKMADGFSGFIDWLGSDGEPVLNMTSTAFGFLADSLVNAKENLWDVHFAMGELFRLAAEEGDIEGMLENLPLGGGGLFKLFQGIGEELFNIPYEMGQDWRENLEKNKYIPIEEETGSGGGLNWMFTEDISNFFLTLMGIKDKSTDEIYIRHSWQ